jgi:prepilin signal peptidase PulO-like enzyme (type II secretory pathway)
LTGATAGVILILLGKKKFKSQISFGPFLVGSTFIAWFWGEKIWHLLV